MGFVFDAAELAEALERAGYDVDPSATAPGADGPATLSGRHEGVAGGVAVVVIDRGGRLKLTVTRDVARERVRDVVLERRRVRLVDTTMRTTVAVLTLVAADDVAVLLAGLERAAEAR